MVNAPWASLLPGWARAKAPVANKPREAKRPQYSAAINGFRGVCVVMVFLFHLGNSPLAPQADPASVWQHGISSLFASFAYGVEMFFMISGYVIVLSMRRHQSVPAFYRDRALRIFPVWVPIVLCVCAVGTLGQWKAFAGVGGGQWLLIVLGNLFLLPPLVALPMAHTASWSLTYEWIFYIATGVCYVASRTRDLIWRGKTASRMALLLFAVAAGTFVICFPRALFFIPGVLVALMPRLGRLANRAPSILLLPVAAAFLASWYSTGVIKAEFDKTLWDVAVEGHGLAILIAFVSATWLFAGVVGNGGDSQQKPGLLEGKLIQQLGTISYSFYLIHPLAMFAVRRVVEHVFPHSHGNSWAAMGAFALGSAVVSVIGAWCSWWLLEQRLARWLSAHWRLSSRAPTAIEPKPISAKP